MMRRVLIMASLFPPQTLGGGPIVSISNLTNAIKDSFEVYVISQNFELKSRNPLKDVVPYIWNEKYGVKVYYISPEERRTNRIYKLICEISPDVIYQNSFFSADQVVPVLYYKKKHSSVRCIVAPRGELGPEKLKNGTLKKRIYIDVLNILRLLNNIGWHATSYSEEKDIKKLFKYNVKTIPNLPSLYSNPSFNIEKSNGELRLFSISRIQRIKNIDVAIDCLGEVNGKIIYDIYGPIEDIEYWEECETKLRALPKNVIVNYKGQIDHDKIEDTISKYHALISPTRGENFGQTIVDSFLNGRPVIISNMTPWSDCDKEAGIVVQLDNLSGFTNAVQFFLDMDSNEYSRWMRGALSYINKKLDTDEIIRRYEELFGG